MEKNSLNRNFKILLNDLILSCSLFVSYRIPYLLNEKNNKDPIIIYLPDSYMNFLKSKILLRDTIGSKETKLTHSLSKDILNESTDLSENHLHDFLLIHLTKSFDNEEFKKLYADYKSRGGIASTLHSPKRLYLNLAETFTNGIDLNESITNKSINNSNQNEKNSYDCLDIFNRQHLAVLFYSQCETSPVFPNICNKPRVINMKYYSENDMTLGRCFFFQI